jgi:hypothetical protein
LQNIFSVLGHQIVSQGGDGLLICSRTKQPCCGSLEAIIEQGTYTGFARGYERYGLIFSEPIGSQISPDGSMVSLFYGEVKINADNRYHPIPRTRPSEE